MRAYRLDSDSFIGLTKGFGLTEIWVLTDNEGRVTREIGFGEEGEIKHRFPGTGPFGERGVFDLNRFDTSESGNLTADAFEQAWVRPS